MSLSTVLALAISAIGVAVALATAVKAYMEYTLQGKQRRAEMFFALRERLREERLGAIAEQIDHSFSGDAEAQEHAAEALAILPLRDKRDYVGLFEEVAIFAAKGQIEPELAHYMFGYYALLCEECLPFWNNLNYDSPYWKIFHEFCADMRVAREKFINADGDAGPKKVAIIDDEGGVSTVTRHG